MYSGKGDDEVGGDAPVLSVSSVDFTLVEGAPMGGQSGGAT